MAGKLLYVLDIGSSKLRLAVVNNQTKDYHNVLTVVERSYSGFSDSTFFEKEKFQFILQEMIREVVKRFKKKINKIHIGVPSEFSICLCKRINSCFIKPKVINQKDINNLFAELGTADTEKYKTINLSPLKFVLDGDIQLIDPIKRTTQKISMDCSYILAQKSFINIVTEAINAVNIYDIEFLSSTLAQSLLLDKKNTEPYAILDIGHITTSLAIVKGEGLVVLNSFSLGSGHITADLMQLLKISYADADILKMKAKLTILPEKGDKYELKVADRNITASIQYTNDIIKSRIESILLIVNNLLEIDPLYSDIKIYLTGDGISHFKGGKELLNQTLSRSIDMLEIESETISKYQTSLMGLIKLVKQL